MSREKKICIHFDPHSARLRGIQDWIVVEKSILADVELSSFISTWIYTRYNLFCGQTLTIQDSKEVGLEALLISLRKAEVSHLIMMKDVFTELLPEFQTPIVLTLSSVTEISNEPQGSTQF